MHPFAAVTAAGNACIDAAVVTASMHPFAAVTERHRMGASMYP
jgi:hypothetical protein